MREFLFVAFLSTVMAAALARTPSLDGEVCPGCVDSSTAAATSDCPQRAGTSSIILANSGACWDIEGSCVESYPCTPKLTVYVASSEAATVYTRGLIGRTGIGGAKSDITDPTQLLKIYDDYTAVACGGTPIPFNVGANLVFTWDNATCYVGVVGTFRCSGCNQ